MRSFAAAAATGLLLGIAGCSDDVVSPEASRIEVSGPASLYKGATAQFTATVVRGKNREDAPILWTSSDTLIASVDGTGLVRGRSPGAVHIFASAGALRDSVSVGVQDDRTPPSIASLTFDPAAVSLAGGDVMMTFVVRAVDAESGVGAARVLLSQPGAPGGSHPLHRCTADAPVRGTHQDGVWQCTISLNRFLPSGTWRATATLIDRAGAVSQPYRWTDFSVGGSLADDDAPLLRRFTLSPDSVNVRGQDARLGIHVSAADAASGVAAVRISYRYSSGGSGTISLALPATGSVHDGVWSWTPRIAPGTPAGTLSITALEIVDFRGGALRLGPEQLRALGFATEVKLTS